MLYLSTIPKLFLRSLAALNLFCAPNWKLESFSWFTCTYLDGAKNVLIIFLHFLSVKKTFIQKHCRSYFFNVMIHIVITNCCQMNNLENNQWPKAKDILSYFPGFSSEKLFGMWRIVEILNITEYLFIFKQLSLLCLLSQFCMLKKIKINST